MKVELEVTDEIFDEWLVQALKEQYELCAPDVAWCDEDKKYNKNMRKHLKAVLKHNMVTDEYRKWKALAEDES